MRKLLALAIIVTLVFALATPAMAHLIQLPVAPYANIILDGYRDEGYSEVFVVDSYREGYEDGAIGNFWVAWNETGIFWYVEVNDTTPNHEHNNAWERDAVEFFIDWNAAQPDGPHDEDGPTPTWQIRIPSAPAQESDDGSLSSGTLGGDTLVPGEHYVVRPLNGNDLTGGYAMEVWLPIGFTNGGANPLAVGSVLFVDLQVMDNMEGDRRDSQAFLDGSHPDVDRQHNTPEAFLGILTLGEALAVEADDESDASGGGEEADATTPLPRPTPRTGDAGVMALIALMAIAAAGIVVFRRKAVK